MKKILITGSSGFIGTNFINYIKNNHKSLVMLGIDLFHNSYIDEIKINLLKEKLLSKVVGDYKPDTILHFAGITKSNNYKLFYENNVFATINILESVLKNNLLNTDILLISSSAVYGNPLSNPVKEEDSTKPINFYGNSKLSMEYVAAQYINAFGLKINIARPFNIIGIGQPESFVIPSFLNKLLEIKAGKRKPELSICNLKYVRDFIDVQDVVAAFWHIITSGEYGQIYNVCSGIGYSIKDVIEKMALLLKINVEINDCKSAQSKNEIKDIIGDNSKLKNIKWKANINLDLSLRRILKIK